MTGPFTAAVIALLLLGLHIESQALADQFRKEAELGSGAIMPEEVPILLSPWRRFQQRLRALGRGGLSAYIRLARLQAAQVDLAMEMWHRERQEVDTPLEAEQELRSQVISLRKQLAA
jgi:hypothetical protein